MLLSKSQHLHTSKQSLQFLGKSDCYWHFCSLYLTVISHGTRGVSRGQEHVRCPISPLMRLLCLWRSPLLFPPLLPAFSTVNSVIRAPSFLFLWMFFTLFSQYSFLKKLCFLNLFLAFVLYNRSIVPNNCHLK